MQKEKPIKIAILSEICNTHSGSRSPIEFALTFTKHPNIKKVYFYCYDYQKDLSLVRYLEKRGIKVIALPIKKVSFLSKLKTSFALPRLFKTYPVDVISYHGTLPVFIVARTLGVPIVRTYHGTQLNAYLEKIPSQPKTSQPSSSY